MYAGNLVFTASTQHCIQQKIQCFGEIQCSHYDMKRISRSNFLHGTVNTVKTYKMSQLLYDKGSYHIETSLLICRANIQRKDTLKTFRSNGINNFIKI